MKQPRNHKGKSNVTFFNHAVRLLEYVELLFPGNTPIRITLLFYAEITPSRCGRGGVQQSPISIDAAIPHSANSYNKQILSFPNNCSIQRFVRHCDI